jgi:predicted MFS family arabinose efflux permease
MRASTYGQLLRTPSVPWLLATSVVGRFNQGMTGLALLLLVTQRSTYAVAGAVSAAYLAGAFVAGPVLSRLADAHGRRRLLAVTAVLFALAMGALALVPPRPLLLAAFALVAGLCVPPVTASIRAVLPALVPVEQRRSVFALESTVQELIFVLGPPATAGLAALGGPRLAVAAAGAMVLVGTLGFVRDHNADAGRHSGPRLKGGRVLRSPGIPGVIAAGTALVSAFAAETVGVVALVSGRHASSAAALTLACTSFGSLFGGLIYGSRRHHRAELRHLLMFVAAGLALVLLAPDRLVLTALLFCWGFTIAPALSRLFERLSSLSPPGATTEAFGWMGSGLTAGNAMGSALGGVLVTAYGGRAAIAAAVGFVLVAALVSEPWPALARRPFKKVDVDVCAEVAS